MVPMTLAQVAQAVGRHLRLPVSEQEAVAGGGNNQLFRVRAGAQCLAVKHYLPDERDRLGAEFGALQFLTRHGIDAIPAPLASDTDLRLGIYQWIDGVRPTQLADTDIAAMLAWVGAVQRLRHVEAAQSLPPASHASLDFAAPLSQFEQRLSRLRPVLAATPDLRAFIEDALLPFQQALLAPYTRLLAAHGQVLTDPLPAAARCLSPSDFGRHNLLRRPDGQLCFLDFEYFGWDDAVKFSCDFALHPGSGFSPGQQTRILQGCLQLFAPDDRLFAVRLPAMLGLCGALWCLIILNVFIPEIWQRRVLAGEVLDQHAAGAQQLARARAFLSQLREVIDDCPTL